MRLNSLVTNNLIKKSIRKTLLKTNEFLKKNDTKNLRLDCLYPTLNNSNQNQFDLYVPDEPNNHLIVDIHGNIFSYGDKYNDLDNNYKLCQKGFTVLSLNFIKPTAFDFKASIKDILQCITFIIENKNELGVNFDKVSLKTSDSGFFLCLSLILSLKEGNLYWDDTKDMKKDFNISNLIVTDPCFDLDDYLNYFLDKLNDKAFEKVFGVGQEHKNDFSKYNFKELIKGNLLPEKIFVIYKDNIFYKYLETLKQFLLNNKKIFKLIENESSIDISKEINDFIKEDELK